MILDDIVLQKKKEIDALKQKYELSSLIKLAKDLPDTRGFKRALPKGEFSIIAETKKASPSAGVIKKDYDPVLIAKEYERAGATAISVLTDEKFFQGSLNDLQKVKASVILPVLRKDFIIDKIQIYESRLAGADAILLIAAILNKNELNENISIAAELGLDCLVEVHNEKEMEIALNSNAEIIGVNNRDLRTFKVDIETTPKLLEEFPETRKRIIVSESGVKTSEDVVMLFENGVDAILIGETLMKSGDVYKKIKELFF